MATINLEGRIDRQTAPGVKRDLLARLTAAPELRLDLSGVTWIDSAGLASLVQILAEARRLGGDLVVAAASEVVERMMKLARLEALFQPGHGEATA